MNIIEAIELVLVDRLYIEGEPIEIAAIKREIDGSEQYYWDVAIRTKHQTNEHLNTMRVHVSPNGTINKQS